MNHRLSLLLLAFIMAGCTTEPAPAQTIPPAIASQETPTRLPPATIDETDPFDWLLQIPFQASPQKEPDWITEGLPEGFINLDSDFNSAELPSGQIIWVGDITYQRPVAGQVYVEDEVKVQLFTYESMEGRGDHLDLLREQGYLWSFVEVGGKRLLRYQDGVDGRVWVSGPYLIVLYSGLDRSEQSPWVEFFTELYAERFPPD